MKKQSIINKLSFLNVAAITAAMLVVLIVFSTLYFSFARNALIKKVQAEARLLAANAGPMLVFHDRKEAIN